MWRQDEEPDHDPVEAEPAVLPELVEESAARHGARPAQRYKGGIYDRSLSGVAFDEPPDGEFATLTYEQLRTIVRRLAVGLRSLGLDPGQRVGLFAETRAEWAQCDLGTLAAGGVVVPIAPNLPTDRVRRRLTAVDGAGVVVENERLALRLLELIDELDLRFILSMDELPSMYDDRDGIYTLADVFEHGERYYRDDIYESWLGDHDPGSPASIVYSAGATDRPSRASLTHRNVLANVEQVLDRYGPQSDGEGPVIDEQTRTVSVLPLAYEFERVVGQFVPLAAGGCIGYADGPETLVEDCQALEPTMLTGVPALYERLYDDLRAHAADGSIGRRLFEWAANVGIRFERHGRPGVGLLTRRALADQLVFSENRAHLGGTLELLFSSGGTFSTELSALFHAMGLPIDQCYGLAEATSVEIGRASCRERV